MTAKQFEERVYRDLKKVLDEMEDYDISREQMDVVVGNALDKYYSEVEKETELEEAID